MTQGERSTAGWWANAPADRVVRLEGAAIELLRLSLDPLPGGAPAVIGCRPAGLGLLAEQVEALLGDLERAAAELFPLWLPGAAAIAGPQGAGAAAVRSLARETAAGSAHFGPFLADLAERSLRQEFAAEPSAPSESSSLRPDSFSLRRKAFPPAVRAAGLARVIADSYGRTSAALLIELPEGLSAAQERTVVASAEWLAHQGSWAVWLSGAPLREVDRIDSYRVELPEDLARFAGATDLPPEREFESEHESIRERDRDREPLQQNTQIVSLPAVTGRPRADSRAEMKLEAALSMHPWATGRAWNTNYQLDPLAPACRLDLWWAAELCVVEIDGPEHRNAVNYAADRSRDVRLQLAGNAVLRFTNDQVLTDVSTVVSQIERLIRRRRTEALEDQRHAH